MCADDLGVTHHRHEVEHEYGRVRVDTAFDSLTEF